MSIHPDTLRALDEVDAALFTGDPYQNRATYDEYRYWLDRWQRRLSQSYEDYLSELEND